MNFVIKKISISAAALLALTSCEKGVEPQEKTSEVGMSTEKTPEWETIFDGKTLDGWTPKITFEPLGDDKDKTFEAIDGVIRVSYENYDKFDMRFGHLFYEQKLSHYKLKLEYRFFGEQKEGGPSWANVNSGVMLHSQPPETIELDQQFPVSVEGQFLGMLPDNSPRTTANVCTPGTHVVIDGVLISEHCITSDIAVLPLGEWVSYEVEVLGNGRVSQFINGKPTFVFSETQYDPSDVRSAGAIRAGLFENGLTLSEGYIALQAESAPVEFRNIQLLNLSSTHGSH